MCISNQKQKPRPWGHGHSRVAHAAKEGKLLRGEGERSQPAINWQAAGQLETACMPHGFLTVTSGSDHPTFTLQRTYLISQFFPFNRADLAFKMHTTARCSFFPKRVLSLDASTSMTRNPQKVNSKKRGPGVIPGRVRGEGRRPQLHCHAVHGTRYTSRDPEKYSTSPLQSTKGNGEARVLLQLSPEAPLPLAGSVISLLK